MLNVYWRCRMFFFCMFFGFQEFTNRRRNDLRAYLSRWYRFWENRATMWAWATAIFSRGRVYENNLCKLFPSLYDAVLVENHSKLSHFTHILLMT